MNVNEAETALRILEQSNAAPEIKALAHRLVVDIVAAGSSAAQSRATEELSEMRSGRILKYSLGWVILGAFVLVFGTAFGHAVGLWTIARTDQLPWVWGSALTLAVSGTYYLLKVFFPK